MDSRRAPTQVGASHFANEATQRSVLSWASERRTRFPPPEDTKAVPMPADDSLGFDDEEGTAPVGPDLREPGPEGSIDCGDWRVRRPLFEEGELLAEGKIFECQVPVRSKRGSNRSE